MVRGYEFMLCSFRNLLVKLSWALPMTSAPVATFGQLSRTQRGQSWLCHSYHFLRWRPFWRHSFLFDVIDCAIWAIDYFKIESPKEWALRRWRPCQSLFSNVLEMAMVRRKLARYVSKIMNLEISWECCLVIMVRIPTPVIFVIVSLCVPSSCFKTLMHSQLAVLYRYPCLRKFLHCTRILASHVQGEDCYSYYCFASHERWHLSARKHDLFWFFLSC